MTQGKKAFLPKASIGMPVYNGEQFIMKALHSILAQTFTEFELIISDNASTDGTEAICREYAARDRRIRYVRQPANFGALFNFQFVLNKANGKYFMWAAHDDTWGKDFLSLCIDILTHNTKIFACITNVLIDGHTAPNSTSGTTPLTGSEIQRAITFLKSPGANSRFYSLYRTADLQKSYVPYEHLASDWSNIIDFIRYGEFITVKGYCGFNKTLKGIGSQPTRFSKFRKSRTELVLPYFEFSKRTLRRYPHPIILLYLLRLNLLANKQRFMTALSTSNSNSLNHRDSNG